MLQETKEVLEDQLAGWRARSDKIHQLEKHSLLLTARIHDIEEVSITRAGVMPSGNLNLTFLCFFLSSVRREKQIRGALRS